MGIKLDDKLNWNKHMEDLRIQINKKLSLLYRLLVNIWGVRLSVAKRIYETVILPKLFYCSFVWYESTLRGRNKMALNTMHNTAIRRLAGGFERSSTEILEIAMGILPIELELKKQVIRDIIRMESMNIWNTNREFGMYKLNRILDIEDWTGERCDMTIGKIYNGKAESYTLSQESWKDGKCFEAAGSLCAYTDASVDNIRGRCGTAAYSYDLDIKSTESTYGSMSSYKAESYGLKQILKTIFEKEVEDCDVSVFCDNRTLVEMATKSFAKSKMIEEYKNN